jgi:nascent polypeptide-associated complex subunit alpha
MFPNLGGIDPRKLDTMMKKMGIENKTIEATKVIIETTTNKITINNPSVTEVSMQGQKTYQIVGEPTIENKGPSSEDISLVAESANVSEEQAKKALEETNGDLAKAIDFFKKEE